jgi:hypothetical protein
MTERVADMREAETELPATGLAAQIAELEETVQTLNNLLSTLSARMLRNIDDLKEDVRGKVGYGDLAAMKKDLEKIRGRIDDVVDEVGYGETLDVSKVPPAILEHAYQAILDDVLAELKKARGGHDAEEHIALSLEQLRLKTSGSELFHYRPQTHRVQVGVAKPIEKGLVSARQVQMTFEELVRHLVEPIHYHQPKNFRALIKIKSQEFAVDKALSFATVSEKTTSDVNGLKVRIDRLEEHVSGALRDMRDFASSLQPMLAGAATRESVEALAFKIAAIEERLKADSPPTGGSAPPASREAILTALADAPRTLASLVKELGIGEPALRAALEALEKDGHLSSTTRGRNTTYRRKEATNHA